ncbi:GrpB family protein [Billgrantia kenyensis]|uniref:GrpB family protein n=1 Tax=Billgrantia kenyensis TaxID=321266 RepID=A0A7V9W3K1_9GAMM|nr:GrpB family protein [Halomonas kenyensis]MBA2780409.1 GrpB family protein [Halomonas kenyensis]MCG6663383.1 GrpB family protein [Halomonas kenyensis]
MNEAQSLQQAIDEPVRLAEYDPAWPARFDAERSRLLERFSAELIEVQHIGSTAIPGMPAKPIIDVMAGVASMAMADALFEPILDHGYVTSREFNAVLTDRRWFMRHANGHRTHHLHVVVHDGELWRQRLVFRDALRADPAQAERYALLKAELAARHPDDREAYTQAKADFITWVLAGPS